MFSYFIFDTRNPSLGNSDVPFTPKYVSFFKATVTYVNSMSNRWAPFIFCPAVYLLISIGVLLVAKKHRERLPKEHFLFSFWLSFASIFWLLSQIPIVPVPDYRYAYFSIVFTMLGLVFLMSGLRQGRLIDEQNCTQEEGKK